MATIFTSQVPINSGADSQVNVGIAFTIDTAGYESTGGRYYLYDTLGEDGLTIQMGLWDGSGALIASGSRVQLVADVQGWITVPWSSPVALSTGQTYTVAYLTPGATGYTFESAGLTSAIDNAPLHSVATGGRFTYGASLARPTTTTTTNFFADVVVQVAAATGRAWAPYRGGKTWRRRYRHHQTPWLLPADAGLSVDVESPSGTGQAFDTTVDIQVQPGTATGTGVANDAVAALGVNAETSSGTGQAFDVAPDEAGQAGTATGTGTGLDSSAAIAVNAETASGTGAAFDTTVSTVPAVQAPAEAATGTGAAFDAVAAVGANAGAATGTGAAQDAQAALGANAETPSGTGQAFDAGPSGAAQAGTATGTGAAGDGSAALGVNAGTATGTGQAFDTTVTTSGSANAPAQTATGTGTGYDATTAMTALAGAATGTGSAYDTTVVTFVPAVTYIFRTPTVDRPYLTTDASRAQTSLGKFYQGYPKRGVAVIIWPDNTVTERRVLYGDEHLTARYIFTGGRENVVDTTAAAILIAAGYALTPIGG